MKCKIPDILIIFSFILGIISGCKKEEITHTTNFSCPISGDPANSANSKSARFQVLMNTYKKKGLPGINLLVEDSTGLFIGSAGMADIEKKVRMQPCHITKIASITKMFMCVLALKLQEDGKLDIRKPVSEYLSASELDEIENAGSVTVQNLMNHSSGIYDVIKDQGFYLQVLNDPTRHWDPADLLRFVRGKKAIFPPNSSSGYSNTNTLLLSLIINKSTGVHHSKLLHNYLFTPLNLNDTYYNYHDALPENKVAQGYFDLYKNRKIINLSNWNTGSGNGYGGIYSTVGDLHTFMKALFVNKTILADSSLSRMMEFNEQVLESRKYLGLGIFKDFIDLQPGFYGYGHRGRDLAYSADLFYFPSRKTILAMQVNYGTDSDSDLKPVFIEFRDKVAELIAE